MAIERAARATSDLDTLTYPDGGWQGLLPSSPHGALNHTNKGILFTYPGRREGAGEDVATKAGIRAVPCLASCA